MHRVESWPCHMACHCYTKTLKLHALLALALDKRCRGRGARECLLSSVLLMCTLSLVLCDVVVRQMQMAMVSSGRAVWGCQGTRLGMNVEGAQSSTK